MQQFKAHSEDATKRSRPLFSDDARDLKDALDLELEADVSARLGTQGARPTALAPAPGFASSLGTYVVERGALDVGHTPLSCAKRVVCQCEGWLG